MKVFFLNLSDPIPFIITIIVFMIAVVIIAIKGKFVAKIGTKIFKIGKNPDIEKEQIYTSSSPSTLNVRKRSCGDCVLVLMAEREKKEIQMRRESDKNLKIQMIFVEQKLIEIQTKIAEEFNSLMDQSVSIDKSIQYKLFYGLFKDAFIHIKDEIRRSFKDNGFYEMSESDFSWYIKDRIQVIMSMLTQYFRNFYPNNDEIIELNKIIGIFEKEKPFLSDTISNLYCYAREVKIEFNQKIESIKKSFSNWVDNFIK